MLDKRIFSVTFDYVIKKDGFISYTFHVNFASIKDIVKAQSKVNILVIPAPGSLQQIILQNIDGVDLKKRQIVISKEK
jgi:hypothetical protein